MGILFEATRVRGMRMPNRFARSATWEGLAAEDGSVTDALVEWMAVLAQGGAGLLVTGHAYVQPAGQASPRQLAVYDDRFLPGLRRLVNRVHRAGGTVVMQLAHAGYFARARLTGQVPLAPSAVDRFARSPRKELTLSGIREIVDAFAAAAERARQAGFDGVQLHAAHGYLLSQFLSPAFNLRHDAYGGPVENRARMVVEVLERVRERVGPEYPVLVKMNCEDFLEGGLTLEDSVAVAKMLDDRGIDAVELSGGTLVSGELNPSRAKILSENEEAYFEPAAREFRRHIDVPLILVGGIRSYGVAERIVREGSADYISMSRPFIREPDLIRRWESGDLRKAECISDNKCFGPALAGKGIRCVSKSREAPQGDSSGTS